MTQKRGKKKLNGISDIRRYFHRNPDPIYFISATNFNLLGLDEWVKNFKYINYMDCYDGRHPNTLAPRPEPHPEFQSIEEINNYLLEHKEVIDWTKRRGGKPKAVFLMFDESTEKLAKELGLKVWMPSAKLRSRLDDKIATVRIGNKAGVPSVPNMLVHIRSYDDLMAKAEKHGLGRDLVLQSAYGDSGHTTFFVSKRRDFDRHAAEIVDQGEIKVMKRVDVRQATLEACTTRRGTIVGPLMTEIVGFPELTPYRGGWAGNEIFADAFTPEIREKARDLTFRFGEQLRKEGYRGYFDLDFLIDKKTGEIWLGELNPRITGASSMTNHAAFAHADAPLFMFHLLEMSGVDFDLDVHELNARWSDPENIDSWSQLVIKHTEETVDVVETAPETGIYKLTDEGMVFNRFDYHRRAVENEDECFFMRIAGPGDVRYEGADLGILITRGRLMTKGFRLNKRARRWIEGVKSQYAGRPPADEGQRVPAPGAFKIF